MSYSSKYNAFVFKNIQMTSSEQRTLNSVCVQISETRKTFDINNDISASINDKQVSFEPPNLSKAW